MNTRASLILGITATLVVGLATGAVAFDKPKVGSKAPGAKASGSSAPAKTDSGTTESEDGTQFVLTDSSQTVTHDCKGGQAVVSGSKNNAKLKNCSQTAVNGNNNTVDVTGVESLAVTGNDNVVTWHGKPGGDEASVADGGARNKISGK